MSTVNRHTVSGSSIFTCLDLGLGLSSGPRWGWYAPLLSSNVIMVIFMLKVKLEILKAENCDTLNDEHWRLTYDLTGFWTKLLGKWPIFYCLYGCLTEIHLKSHNVNNCEWYMSNVKLVLAYLVSLYTLSVSYLYEPALRFMKWKLNTVKVYYRRGSQSHKDLISNRKLD